tara:strand:+ start:1745 stop:2908 length:1164 start_codon:yes stop_codon:yes gene_type:complete
MATNPFEGVQLVTPNTPTENSDETTPTEETPKQESSSTVPPGIIDLTGLEDERPFLEKVRKESTGTFTTEDPSEANATSNGEPDTVYSALVKELQDKGILETKDGIRVESADDLAALFDETLNSRLEENVNGFVQNFSGHKKMFLEIEDAFDDELVAMRVARDIEYYNQVTPDVLDAEESVQKDIFSRYLRAKGMNASEIAESLEEATTLAKLSEKAQTALPQLKAQAQQFVATKRKEKEERVQRQTEKEEESFKTLINSVDGLNEILPGVELTTRHKTAMKKAMTDVAYTDPNSGAQFTELGHKQNSNPQGFEKLIQFYNILGLFNTDREGNFKPDMAKVSKMSEKQVKRKLDELIREQQQTSIPGQKSSAGTKLNLSFWDEAFGE